jgi:formylglycine-generating enzyme required for sulfatase activity
MPVLFVSHASKDDTVAVGLETWLRDRGFTDIFIDHSNITGGEKWAQALRDASAACRVIVCLVTENWLASDECFGEFKAAWYMGKRIIPLLVVPTDSTASSERLAKVLAEDQGINIATCVNAAGQLDLVHDQEVERRLEAGLRAAGALVEIGLDPEAFAIDRKARPTPFPGLASFGDDDANAALFYGRSREIAETLDELRQMRALGDLRPFVILGASGAGKSSLLKAGIIPRLRREAPAWLPVRAFRPGTDPLLNFAEAFARSLADFSEVEAPGVIRDRLLDSWSSAERDGDGLTTAGRLTLEQALESEGRKLRAAAGHSGTSILISIDQAEEMARAEGNSADALADYMRAALAASARGWQLAFTIRADSFPELQSHRRFSGLNARGYDLRALPAFRFETVVEQPARRYGVVVDDALVDALIEDTPKQDGLPLLAFALQRLWRQYADSKALTQTNYARVGGLRGLIEDAAERALRSLSPEQDVPLPSDPPSKREIDLAASTFVPALAQINDRGATIRRIAAWNSFTDEQRGLLLRFDQWRLVVRKGGIDGGTVEVAHEALFREWTRLKLWLEPERARLEALRSLEVDALTWDRSGRDPAFLNHRDKRLAEALTLAGIGAYRNRLGRLESDYLSACETAERSARKRARRVQRIIYGLLLGIIAGLVGWINQSYIRQEWRWYAVTRPFIHANVQPRVLSAATEQGLKPGETFRECTGEQTKDYCPEMVVVPPGSFVMGSPLTEKGRFTEEGPLHSVTIGQKLAVSKFELTFDEWDSCATYGDCAEDVSDSGFGRGQRPVINVTWADAQQYVAWLSKVTGKHYWLLSEAEYEYATRAGTQTVFPWGDDVGKNNANCAGCDSEWDEKQTAPVGSFSPNKFGLFDMVGNVWEWVEDCEHGGYAAAPIDGSAWIEDGNCSYRIIRGGSWYVSPESARSADRYRATAIARRGDLGFRVARTLEP